MTVSRNAYILYESRKNPVIIPFEMITPVFNFNAYCVIISKKMITPILGLTNMV